MTPKEDFGFYDAGKLIYGDLEPVAVEYCYPDSAASRRACEIDGGDLIETVDIPKDDPMYRKGRVKRECRYRIDLI